MSKYLTPTADLTFKKVFGQHPDLMMSLLNAMLPLPEGEEITEIEYLPAELVPDTPIKKNSIVDVRCREKNGRQFIVEMQLEWTTNFMQRVLFNASKAYVRQLDKNEHYEVLQPVYALSFVNAVFEPDMKTFYHHYALVHSEDTGKVIEGLQLIFIELPKFHPTTFTGKKMQVLWLRYLTEIDENTRMAPPELLENPEVRKALDIIEESAYTEGEMYAYDEYWDAVRTEKTLSSGKWAEGKAEGLAEGKAEGLAEGMEKGEAIGIEKGREEGHREAMCNVARQLKNKGMKPEDIAAVTGLEAGEITQL